MKLTWREQLELDEWLSSWSPSRDIEDLLRCSLGRNAIKELGRVRAKMSGGPSLGMWSAFPSDEVARHIVDWLTADLMDGADWLERIDGQSRPLKLMKCGSFEQLTHEADKAMRRRLGGTAITLGEGDETVVAELAEGFTLVQLLTPLALDYESKRMRHCVGHGSYDRGLEDGTTRIYSMRDADGNPCVTIETYTADIRQYGVDDDGEFRPIMEENPRWAVNQIQEKANARPKRKHMDMLKAFLNESGWADWKSWYPIVVDAAGVEHEADRIPPGIMFERLSFMSVNAVPDVEIELPENLFIRDGLDLRDAIISKLPEGLRVGDDLNIGDNVITTWPTDMIIGGFIHGGENCAPELIPPWVREKMEEGRRRRRECEAAMRKIFDSNRAFIFSTPLRADETDADPTPGGP